MRDPGPDDCEALCTDLLRATGARARCSLRARAERDGMRVCGAHGRSRVLFRHDDPAATRVLLHREYRAYRGPVARP